MDQEWSYIFHKQRSWLLKFASSFYDFGDAWIIIAHYLFILLINICRWIDFIYNLIILIIVVKSSINFIKKVWIILITSNEYWMLLHFYNFIQLGQIFRHLWATLQYCWYWWLLSCSCYFDRSRRHAHYIIRSIWYLNFMQMAIW